MPYSKWMIKAQRLLGNKALHRQGNGRFAVVTLCDFPTFTLWPTKAQAERDWNHVESCGAGCRGKESHFVRDLEVPW